MKSPAAKGGTSLPEGSGGRAPPSSGECREDYVFNFDFVKSQQLAMNDSENGKRVSGGRGGNRPARGRDESQGQVRAGIGTPLDPCPAGPAPQPLLARTT
jgi:hypothetical protein